jgi:hypothetical protein
VITPDATDEEVAAILAAIAEQTRSAAVHAGTDDHGSLREWTHASRVTSRRSGLQRGPWRLSGRIGRRSRA